MKRIIHEFVRIAAIFVVVTVLGPGQRALAGTVSSSPGLLPASTPKPSPAPSAAEEPSKQINTLAQGHSCLIPATSQFVIGIPKKIRDSDSGSNSVTDFDDYVGPHTFVTHIHPIFIQFLLYRKELSG